MDIENEFARFSRLDRRRFEWMNRKWMEVNELAWEWSVKEVGLFV